MLKALLVALTFGLVALPAWACDKPRQMDGFKTLAEGQTVEFEVGQGRKGEEAQNVRPV